MENGNEKCFYFIYKVSVGSRMEMIVRINNKKSEYKAHYIYSLLTDHHANLFRLRNVVIITFQLINIWCKLLFE